jgi:hypothetical protein
MARARASSPLPALIGVGGFALVGFLVWKSRQVANDGSGASTGDTLPSSIGQGAGVVVGQAAASVIPGVVIGIGDVIGIPRTDMTECQRAVAERTWWAASSRCSVSNFLRGITGRALDIQ